jgi:hypothetical protein
MFGKITEAQKQAKKIKDALKKSPLKEQPRMIASK